MPKSAMKQKKSVGQTLKFGQRESYELADSPSAGHKTNITPISTGSSSPVVASTAEDGVAAVPSANVVAAPPPNPKNSVRRVSVASVPSPTSSINMGHRGSVQSC